LKPFSSCGVITNYFNERRFKIFAQESFFVLSVCLGLSFGRVFV
jgi:hypothetical protein